MDKNLWLLGHQLSMLGLVEQAWEIRTLAHQYGDLADENLKRLPISIMLSKLQDNINTCVGARVHELLDHYTQHNPGR